MSKTERSIQRFRKKAPPRSRNRHNNRTCCYAQQVTLKLRLEKKEKKTWKILTKLTKSTKL